MPAARFLCEVASRKLSNFQNNCKFELDTSFRWYDKVVFKLKLLTKKFVGIHQLRTTESVGSFAQDDATRHLASSITA